LDKHKCKNSFAQQEPPAQVSPRTELVIYDGDEDTCSLCYAAFEAGERVCRLRCRHMFHAACWENLLTQATRDECPNCRGAGTLISIWHYVDPTLITQHTPEGQVPNELEAGAEIYQIDTPGRRTPVSNHDGDGTPRSGIPSDITTYMCGAYVGDESRPPGVFHVQTRLPDGRPSLIVDPGSVGNLCGDEWARSVAATAHKYGHNPSYAKRDRPLRVQGVGNGAQSCGYDCTLPIALRQKDKSVAIGKLVTPTVSKSDLPGLLGLAALTKNRGILDFNTMELHFWARRLRPRESSSARHRHIPA